MGGLFVKDLWEIKHVNQRLFQWELFNNTLGEKSIYSHSFD